MKKRDSEKRTAEAPLLSPAKQERILQKVEEMGVFFEKQGLTPMIGRVFAYLLLCDPPNKDFFEIQDALQASKSAISNALNHLQTEGTVNYVTFTSDRRRYFRISPKGWMENLKLRVRSLQAMEKLIDDVLAERADSNFPAMSQDIAKLAGFLEAMNTGIEHTIAEWEKKHP